MSNVRTGRTQHIALPARYDIWVIGRLTARWAVVFDGMTLTAHDDGTTVISGPVADQSALHGLLGKVSDLGLPLVSVQPATEDVSAGRNPKWSTT